MKALRTVMIQNILFRLKCFCLRIHILFYILMIQISYCIISNNLNQSRHKIVVYHSKCIHRNWPTVYCFYISLTKIYLWILTKNECCVSNTNIIMIHYVWLKINSKKSAICFVLNVVKLNINQTKDLVTCAKRRSIKKWIFPTRIKYLNDHEL